MSNKHHLPACAVICVLVACNCFGVVFRQYDFPELVSEAPVIAVGEITLSDGRPVFSVREVLKGHLSLRRLSIDVAPLGDMPAVQFTNAENVLLFLDEPGSDGSAKLFGCGDQGKWPRAPAASGFPPVLNRASAAEISGVVRDLVRVNEIEGAEAKSKEIRAWMKSSDKVRQLLAIQYVSDDLLWPRDKRSGSISVSPHERRGILDRFVADLSQLAGSDEVSIRRDAIRALRFAPVDLVRPVLEKAASDTNESVRAAVREVLTEKPNGSKNPSGTD